MIEVYIDGASIGNPGKIGIGYLIYRNGKIIKEEKVYLGIGTNNFAEYMALIFSLQEVLIQNLSNVNINTDSELLCKQINGEYKVKDPTLKLLHCLATNIIANIKNVSIVNIPRENNKGADKLAVQAIEKRPVLLKAKKKNKASQDDQLLGLA